MYSHWTTSQCHVGTLVVGVDSDLFVHFVGFFFVVVVEMFASIHYYLFIIHKTTTHATSTQHQPHHNYDHNNRRARKTMDELILKNQFISLGGDEVALEMMLPGGKVGGVVECGGYGEW